MSLPVHVGLDRVHCTNMGQLIKLSAIHSLYSNVTTGLLKMWYMYGKSVLTPLTPFECNFDHTLFL